MNQKTTTTSHTLSQYLSRINLNRYGMDHLSPQQNSGTQHGESIEGGNTRSNILCGSTSSADNASARNDESGENTAASPNLHTTDHQKTCDKDNVPPKPQMEAKGAQTNTNEYNPVTSPNTANNGHSVSSSNAGDDDKVTSRYAGNDDTNPHSQQQTGTILADNPEALGADFVSMKPQPGPTRHENGRRTEEEEYSKSSLGSASESSDPSIELPSLTGLHRSRHDAKQRGDEPVLTLYRRHSEDPFFMYNTISNIHTSDPPAHNTGHAAVVDLNPRSSESSTARQANNVEADGSVHSGLEKGTTTGASRGMPVIHEAVGVSAGRVSLNGIHVGVKKKPPVKKMAKMQSPRVQCCMCAVSVMSALFGMFMLSAGVCLVLNYNFLDVDTSGLPPNLHNEEGKKVVGIILICVGIAALGVSGLVSILFYTACSRSSSSSSSSKKGEEGEVEGPLSSQDSHGRHGYYNSNGTTPVRHPPANGVSGARRSGGAAAPLPGGRRGNDPRGRGPAAMPGVGREGAAAYTRGSGTASRNGVQPSGSRPYRPGKKSRHHNQGRFRNSLPSHPEEACAEAHSLGGSRRLASSARRQTDPNTSGYVNQGAQLDDDPVIASGSSESTVTPSVVIKVDSSYLHEKADPASLSPPQQGQSDAELTKHSSSAVASASAASSESSRGSVDIMDNDRGDVVQEDADEEESGRISRSTVDSPDITEGSEESPEDASKRLDAQITTLLS